MIIINPLNVSISNNNLYGIHSSNILTSRYCTFPYKGLNIHNIFLASLITLLTIVTPKLFCTLYCLIITIEYILSTTYIINITVTLFEPWTELIKWPFVALTYKSLRKLGLVKHKHRSLVQFQLNVVYHFVIFWFVMHLLWILWFSYITTINYLLIQIIYLIGKDLSLKDYIQFVNKTFMSIMNRYPTTIFVILVVVSLITGFLVWLDLPRVVSILVAYWIANDK